MDSYQWWSNFHEKLDSAIASFIEDTGNRPSEVSLMEFMEYSNNKKEECLK